MKKAIRTYGKLSLRILLLTAVALIGLSGCARGSKKAVTSVETMTLTLRGMRGGYVYTLVDNELRYYREVYEGEETVLALEKQVACDAQTIVGLMNTCGVMRWDGFHGKHPQDVMDGASFGVTANVNDGKTIEASGSANYPKGYGDLIYAMKNMLKDSENN